MIKKLLKTDLLLVYLVLIIGCTKEIIPDNKNIKIFYYSDATGDNGKSEIFNDSCVDGVMFNYTLREGFSYPYAGVSISADSGYFDLHTFKYLDLILSADTICPVNIYMKSVEDSITVDGNHITYRFLEKTIWITEKPQLFRLELSSFTTPQWWLQLHKIKKLGDPDLKRIRNFDIATDTEILNRSGFIHIHSLKLKKDFTVILYLAFIIFSAMVSALLLININNRKKKTLPKVISYKQQDNQINSFSEDNNVFDLIGKRYAESNLSLEIIAEDLRIYKAKISNIIKTRFGLSFRQYLNMIRITEAKRLLIETDRQILDIALSTGYGDVSHFNRIFKQMTGCSPREYRKTNRQ